MWNAGTYDFEHNKVILGSFGALFSKFVHIWKTAHHREKGL